MDRQGQIGTGLNDFLGTRIRFLDEWSKDADGEWIHAAGA
jgi:hypothetical protein